MKCLGIADYKSFQNVGITLPNSKSSPVCLFGFFFFAVSQLEPVVLWDCKPNNKQTQSTPEHRDKRGSPN